MRTAKLELIKEADVRLTGAFKRDSAKEEDIYMLQLSDKINSSTYVAAPETDCQHARIYKNISMSHPNETHYIEERLNNHNTFAVGEVLVASSTCEDRIQGKSYNTEAMYHLLKANDAPYGWNVTYESQPH